MINKILMKLGIGDASLNDARETRRKHIRFPAAQQAEVVINNQSHNIVNWSMGGIAFKPVSHDNLQLGEKINFTLLFRFADDIISVEQSGRIIRNGTNAYAVEFVETTQEARRGLQRALDGHHSHHFLQSQVA